MLIYFDHVFLINCFMTQIPAFVWYCSCCCRDGKPPNFAMKAGMGIAAGAVGSFIGTPAEISLIRMTADGRYVYQ